MPVAGQKFRDRLGVVPDDSRPGGGYGAAMVQAIHLQVDLRVENEAISGSASDQRGRRSTFVGWLGLIAVVERAQVDLEGRNEVRGTLRPPTGDQIRPPPEPPSSDQCP